LPPARTTWSWWLTTVRCGPPATTARASWAIPPPPTRCPTRTTTPSRSTSTTAWTKRATPSTSLRAPLSPLPPPATTTPW